MSEVFSIYILIIGLLIVVRELKKPSFGWICYPFAMVTFWAMMDIFISPYMVGIFDVRWPESYIVQRTAESKYLSSASILLLWYVSVALGLLTAGHFSKRRSRISSADYVSYSKDFTINEQKVLFRGGLILTAIGLTLNMAVFFFFPQNIDFSDISKLRLVYTTTRELKGPISLIFGYIRMFSYLFQLGIIVLIFNSGRSKKRYFISIVCACIVFTVLTIFGGRESLVLLGISVLFAWQYGKGRISLKTLSLTGAACFLFLLITTSVRFGIDTFGESVAHIAQSILTNHYLDDVSFVTDVFPNKLQWLYGKTTLAFIPGFFTPGFSIDWFESFYHVIVNTFGDRLYYLSTGVHYASAAEAYANLGILGVIGLGLLAGMIFGAIFARQARFPQDSLFTYYTIIVSVHFFSGLSTKMFSAIGAIGFFSLVPIAVLGAVSLKQYYIVRQLLFMVIIFFVMYILYRMTGSTEIKIMATFPIIFLTVMSLRFLWKSKIVSQPSP